MSTIEKKSDEGEVEEGHALIFGTEYYVQHLEHILNYYHLNVYGWAICRIVDSCALNKFIANNMDLPHGGCAENI